MIVVCDVTCHVEYLQQQLKGVVLVVFCMIRLMRWRVFRDTLYRDRKHDTDDAFAD